MPAIRKSQKDEATIESTLWWVVGWMAISPISCLCVWIAGPPFFFDGMGSAMLLPFLPGLLLSPIVMIASMILALIQSKAERPAHAIAFWLLCLTTMSGVIFFSLVELGIAWSHGKASWHWF